MADNLIWTEGEAKDCFNHHHFWTNFPTSIIVDPATQEIPIKKGKNAREKARKKDLPLPLLLWPQQKRRLETQPIKAKVSRKRKRGQDHDDGSEAANAEDSINAPAKRSKPSMFSDIFNQSKKFFQSFYQYFYPVLQPPATLEPVLPVSASSSSSTAASGVVVAQTTKDSHEIAQKPKSYNQQVFDLFQDRGYFIGPGDSYGGDYTLYKGGNPSTSHSIATVLIAPTHSLPARDLLAFGRVQNQVAKSALVVFPVENDEGSIKPEYVVFNFRKVSVRL